MPGRAATESHAVLLVPVVVVSILRCTAASALDLPLQLYLKDLDVQPIVISALSTLAWLGMLLGSSVWGIAGDRFSKRRLLFVLLPASAVTLAAFALQPPPSGVLLIRFIRAGVIAGFAPLTMALVSGASAARRRGRYLSYISSSRALGWVVGGAMSGFLLDALGFRWTVSVLACLPALSILFLTLLRETPGATTKSKGSPWRFLKDKALSGLYLGVALRQMGIAGSFSLIFVYMATLGIPTGLMGAVSALSPLAQVFGLIVFGRLADRLGRERIFLLGFALSTLVAPIFALGRGVVGMAIGHLLVGISFSALYMGSTAHIGDVIPAERHGVMLGLFDSTRALGGVLGPLAAGAIMPALGFAGMFLTMAGIAVLGFVLVLAGARGKMQGAANGT